ncbi:hypothetical protein M513_01173 [Trichuris suis]|uniref:Uncharacterized protein n=1 Tax=Trichuris suis TaxID=68888 RepID=A0A085ML44_9BILA|nr:hypothetical protein M513_01173 [Trichuris suis]
MPTAEEETDEEGWLLILSAIEEESETGSDEAMYDSEEGYIDDAALTDSTSTSSPEGSSAEDHYYAYL